MTDERNSGREQELRCAVVEARLPWLLNGTLEPDERGDMLRHVQTCASCRRALAESHEVGLAADSHLPIDTLLDLADGLLLAVEDQRLAAAHLDTCDQCAEELRALSVGFVAPRVVVRGEPGAASLWRFLAWTAALAAMLFGLGWWRASVDGRGEAMYARQPIANVTTVELRPTAPTRGSDAAIERLSFAADARLVSVILLPEAVASGPRSLDVVGPDGERLWQLDGLQLEADGAVSLLLPAAALQAGDHRLRLRTVNESGAERVEVFVLRVAARAETPR